MKINMRFHQVLFFILTVNELTAQSPVRTEISIKPGAIFNDGISKSTIKLDARAKNPNSILIKFSPEYNGSFTVDGFAAPNISYPMFDDGTHGDETANDLIYSIGGIKSRSVIKDPLGFEMVSFSFIIDGIEYPINFMWLPVVQKEIFRTNSVNSKTMSSDYAVFIFNISLSDRENGQEVVKQFYEFFPDKYDFILLYRDMISTSSAYYTAVKNDIKGIGSVIFNNSGYWGSAGQLQGVICVDTKGQRTIMPENVVMHEIGHRWGSYYIDPLLPLSSIKSHWNASSTINGMMGPAYNSTFVYNGDGTFTFRGFYNYWQYSTIELYTVGVMPANCLDTCELFILKDPRIDQVSNSNIPFGTVIKPEEFVKVTSDTLRKIYGKREPDYLTSQKTFKTATIVLTESQPAEEEICLWNKIIRNYSGPYDKDYLVNWIYKPWWWVPSFACYSKGLVSNNFLISDTPPLGINNKGIEEKESLDFRIYPNPANNILNIELGKDREYLIQITNLNGRLVHKIRMNGTLNQIDLSSFKKGEYIITVKSKDLLITKKFIKI
jgi:hypothetical protein